MYKVYIETNQMIELAEKVRTELLKSDNIIVYMNINRDEELDIKFDAYVKLQNESKAKGPEVIINEISGISNGLAKEIYKSIQKTYYDKTVDNGVIYVKEKVGLDDVPSVKINVVNSMNKDDSKWLNDNIVIIARSISDGIKISFTLKPC